VRRSSRLNTGALNALKTGIERSIRNWRLWIAVYVFNLAFAAILTLPFAEILARDISRSLVGRELLTGFNYRWFVDFVTINGEFFRNLLPQIIFLFAAYLIMEIFFAGGFYSSSCGKAEMKFGDFLAKGSIYFFPIFVVTAIECAVLFLLYLTFRYQLSVTTYQLSAMVLFVVTNLLSDFVRAAVVVDDDRFWRKVKRGLNFTVKHPISTVGVYLCCLSISSLTVALYLAFHSINDSTTAAGVLAEIIVAQIFILLRIFSKVIFYAGEAVLYKENQIEVIKVKLEMLE